MEWYVQLQTEQSVVSSLLLEGLGIVHCTFQCLFSVITEICKQVSCKMTHSLTHSMSACLWGSTPSRHKQHMYGPVADMLTIHWAYMCHAMLATMHNTVAYTHRHCTCLCFSSYRVQRNVVSLCVFKEDDWLQLVRSNYRYDSIYTLVMHCAITTIPIPVGDHVVLTHLQYPVHSPQYYKRQISVWKFVLKWNRPKAMNTFSSFIN